jgi:hypothetical protein
MMTHVLERPNSSGSVVAARSVYHRPERPDTLRRPTPPAPPGVRCRATRSTMADVGANVAVLASARSASCASAAAVHCVMRQ